MSTSKKFTKSCLLVMTAYGLSGCGGPGAKTGAHGLTQAEKASVVMAVPPVSDEKSVLVIRLKRDGGNCTNSGTVRLTPVINGNLDPSRSINAGYTNLPFTAAGFASFGRAMGHMATLDFSGADKEMSLTQMKTSFVSIPPGDYVVTHAQCAYGRANRTWIGGGNSTGWLPPGMGASTPVAGDNFIRVPPSRIVDAGFLNITTIDDGGWLGNAKGTLVGEEVSGVARRYLRGEFPDLYFTVMFSCFSPWPGSKR